MLIRVWAKASRHTCHAALTSSYKEPNPSSGKPQAASSTSALKTNLLFPVRILYLLTKGSDEIKWGLRMPNRFAMRQLSLNYEDEVQKQILSFFQSNVQYDYLNGNREINLEVKLNEAEFLYSANEEIKGMAKSGEL